MPSKYKAMVLSCIDPRCQPKINNILKKKKLSGKYSLFSIAGSAVGVTSSKFKTWHSVFWQNLGISLKLHGIKKLIAVNHYDCGAAKLVNKQKKFNRNIEYKIHQNAFKALKTKLKKKYPKIKLETKIMTVKTLFLTVAMNEII
jgi:carbonic anhydrase